MTPFPADTLVPHAGPMGLLDKVIDWQIDWIHCRSRICPPAEHPLAGPDGLPATALIEYAAQATAAHGTLVARQTSDGRLAAVGRLVALRDIDLPATRAEIAAAVVLDIHAERILADPSGSIYAFRVAAGDRLLSRGRLTIRRMADV